jgi:TetR/AcrR family transcriptional repressor of bet genes
MAPVIARRQPNRHRCYRGAMSRLARRPITRKVASAESGTLTVLDKRRERRRLQLIVAAIDCIAARGIRDTKIQDVAQAAGMAAGSINQYFETKESLFTATLQHLSEEFHWQSEANLARAGEDPAAQLSGFVLTYLHPQICQLSKVAVWFAFWGEVKARPHYRQVCQGFDQDHDATLRRLCLALLDHDTARATMTAKIIAALCQGLWLEFLTGTDGLKRPDLTILLREGLKALFPKAEFPARDQPEVPPES